MPTPDMKPYAERLAKAMTERFLFSATRDDSWTLDALDSHAFVAYRPLRGWDRDINYWAFWGPLAVEFRIRAVWCQERHAGLLEAIAEAVCQEAERRQEEAK